MADDCIFCKLVAGQIPALKIYEDANFIGFLDINPRRRGHAVVIPKRHVKTLLELPEKLAGEYLEVVQAVARHIVGALGAKGFNFGSNNGEAAGQAVAHLHIHIIPRYDTDKHKAGFEAAFQVNEDAKKDIDKTLSAITRGSIIPPVKTASSPARGPEVAKEGEPDKKEGPKWRFNDGDNIMDDNIEH